MKAQAQSEGGARLATTAVLASPLLSVIVSVFQDRDELQALLENITPFRGPNVELVVIDGGSQDGTGDLLASSNNMIDYWRSERDSGVYEAMNKGIAAARGEYILHLNAGDRLLLVPISELSKCAKESVDVVCFRVLLDDSSVHIPRTGRVMNIQNTWHHQGTFYRRSAHLGYDAAYKVFGDFEHNQRLAKSTKSVRIFSDVISRHGTPGLSASGAHFHEVYTSIRKNSGALYVLLAFLNFKIYGVRRRFAQLSNNLRGQR